MASKVKPISAEEVAVAINKLRAIATERIKKPPAKTVKQEQETPNVKKAKAKNGRRASSAKEKKRPKSPNESITSKIIKHQKLVISKKEPPAKGDFYQMWKQFRFPH